MEKYLGDIVIGDIDDIGQPQYHKSTKKQKKYWKLLRYTRKLRCTGTLTYNFYKLTIIFYK